jgi:REP element-mobilizing transposase RayT
MPRPQRTDHVDAWHHFMNRGVARQPIFRCDADRSLFLDLLYQATARAALEVHAYCLLDNHYHLLIRSKEGRLSAGMQWLASRFTQRRNYAESRDGPIFRGRFTSVTIESDAHLLQVLRYIQLNPVAAGLTAEPNGWPWSSAAVYSGEPRGPSWLVMERLLDMFGSIEPRGAYCEFLRAEIDEATRAFYAGLMARLTS